MLTACEISIGGKERIVISNYCLIYQPILDSDKDTKETQEQVLRENSKYECQCNSNCPGISR